jgi:hypothetical protein
MERSHAIGLVAIGLIALVFTLMAASAVKHNKEAEAALFSSIINGTVENSRSIMAVYNETLRRDVILGNGIDALDQKIEGMRASINKTEPRDLAYCILGNESDALTLRCRR